MMKKCILMVRVSTEQQSYDAQMQELHEFAIKLGYSKDCITPVASILEVHYKNIAAMYKEACSFVHFSERQLYDTAKVKHGTRTINLKISEEDALKDEERQNIDRCMLTVNNILIDIVKNISKEYTQPN